MKLLIAAPKKAAPSTEMIRKEAKELFDTVDVVPIKEISIQIPQRFKIKHNSTSIMDYDYFLPRIDSKRASFGYQIIKVLDYLNMKKPYPAETVLISHNKFATVFELAKAGLPVPSSTYTASKDSAKKAIDTAKFPIVIKLVSSFGGKGVLFAEGETAANSIVKTLDLLRQDLMLEQYIPNPGEDVRAFIVGDQVVASMKRIAKKGEKRANIKSGGKAVSVQLTPEEEKISLKAAKAIKAKICAIDMIRGEDGTRIIETNINPGLQGITKATGTNIAKKIAQFCYEEAKK